MTKAIEYVTDYTDIDELLTKTRAKICDGNEKDVQKLIDNFMREVHQLIIRVILAGPN